MQKMDKQASEESCLVQLKGKENGRESYLQKRIRSQGKDYLFCAEEDKKFDQFYCQIELKNKAKNFINKIRRDKQIRYGHHLLIRKQQEQRKCDSMQRKLQQDLKRISEEKERKRSEMEERIRQLKMKERQRSHKANVRQLHSINQSGPKKIKRLRSSVLSPNPNPAADTQKMKQIKTQPDQPTTKRKSKRSLYFQVENLKMIREIKRKLKELQQLSKFADGA